MRHKVAGWKLGRNTSHRRSLLRNLVTSLIVEERIETTVPKAKAMRPLVEKMITLGKRGDLAARRQALAYLMTSAAVDKLFDTIGSALRRPRRRIPAHRSHRMAKRRWRRHGFRRTAGQREAARKKSARSVPKPVPSAPKKPSEPWTKPKRSRASSIPQTTPKARTRAKTRNKIWVPHVSPLLRNVDDGDYFAFKFQGLTRCRIPPSDRMLAYDYGDSSHRKSETWGICVLMISSVITHFSQRFGTWGTQV